MYSYCEEPLSAVQFLYNLESKTATNMEHVNMCVQPLSIFKSPPTEMCSVDSPEKSTN